MLNVIPESLNGSSFLFILFYFFVHHQWFVLVYLPAYWSIPLYHLFCWFLPVYIFSYCIFHLWLFLKISNSLLKISNFSLCAYILLPRCLIIFTQTLSLEDCLSLSSSLEFYLVPLFRTCSCVASFCLTCYFHFCQSGMLVKYSDIEEVVFLGNVLYVPTVHFPLITRAICARSAASVSPSVVAGWLYG